MSFELDRRLAADTILIGDLPLSRALLMNDARYPWIILTPRRAGLMELTELEPAERAQLVEELALVAATLRSLADVAKVNIGALGNIVPQLHVHVVGRQPGDAAWPGPVWGVGLPVAYAPETRDPLLALLREKLKAI